MTQNPIIPPSPRYAPDAPPLPDDAPFYAEADPFDLFARWLGEAKAQEPNDPNAMALATVDGEGLPDVRMVLLKDVSSAGFTFYTNLESAKGTQMAANPKAALCFHWKSLRRQVRVRGPLVGVSAAEADAYFQSRDRGARIGAWASEQSRVLPDRFALEKRVAAFGLKFGVGEVPRPDHWSGFRLEPVSIEFWRDRPFRLHDRMVFLQAEGGWRRERLYP
ncbi:MAG: pyridoxamine 5'-phosphate oxidase [Caulobacterales bacterium]